MPVLNIKGIDNALVLKKELILGKKNDIIFSNRILLDTNNDKQIFVADQLQLKIYIFDSKGLLTYTLGGKGRGPGEFENMSSMNVYGQKVTVLDMILKRITIFYFNKKTVRIETINLKNNHSSHYPSGMWALPDGSYLIKESIAYSNDSNIKNNYKEILAVYNHDGSPVKDSILSFDAADIFKKRINGEVVIAPLPFGAKPIIQIYNNHIYYGRTNTQIIKILSMNGKVLQKISLPVSPAPVTKEDLRNKLAPYENSLHYALIQYGIPSTWPLYDNLLIDNTGKIWISENTINPKNYKWIIIDNDGNVIATISADKKIKIKSIQDNHVYAKTTSGSGETEIAVYKVMGY